MGLYAGYSTLGVSQLNTAAPSSKLTWTNLSLSDGYRLLIQRSLALTWSIEM